MNTTPLPPLPSPEGLTDAERGYSLRQYTCAQMCDYAAQARADLEAEVKRLRATLEDIAYASSDNNVVLAARSALESKP